MILLGLPSYDGVKDGTSVDRMRLIAPAGVRLEPCPIPATNVAEARVRIADIALRERGCSHVLWIDADMRFPCDTLLQLLARDVAIVGANCRARGAPHFPCARRNGEVVAPARGLEEVDVVGFGIVLTQIDVLRSLPDPLFLNDWMGRVNGHPVFRSDDHYFCAKARAAGWKVHVDHDLSYACRHIAPRELGYEQI